MPSSEVIDQTYQEFEGAPLSLYLKLEEGHFADAEVVARATLAFVSAVREVAFMIDPSSDVHIGLVNSTRGSLSINTVLKSFRTKKKRKALLIAVAAAVSAFLGKQSLEKGFDMVADEIIQELSKKLKATPQETYDAKKFARAADERQAGRQQIRRVYQEVNTDPSITAVGVTTDPNHSPVELVRREEFQSRSGENLATVISDSKRVRHETVSALLVSPVLLDSPTRKWRFRSESAEFSASILDANFLREIEAGKLNVPLSGGIEFDMEMDVLENWDDENGVWVISKREITHVLRTRRRPPQGRLSLD